MRKLLTALAVCAVGCASAYATSVTFTFDTQTINGKTITGLSSGANSAAIASYMTQVLQASGCTGCSVTLPTTTSGAGESQGAVADQTYTGDGHVVGPVNSGSVKPITLGDTNGATSNNPSSSTYDTGSGYDTFIANTNDSSSQISNQMTLQFHGVSGLTINSFDYEIFPDGSAQQPPDMTFDAGNGTNGVDAPVATFVSGSTDTPGGSGGTADGVTPSSSGSDGNSTHSTVSGTRSNESSAQYIGTWSGSVTNASELDFVDWPATIGIDNLNVSFTPSSPVPEPISFVLLGTLAGGLFLRKKVRKA